MQQRLTLFGVAGEVTGETIRPYLCDVAADRYPAFDLPLVIGTPSPHVVATVPLEPATWIVLVYPTLFAPDREGLTRADAEEVEFWIRRTGISLLKPCFREPVLREFPPAIAHIYAAKNAEREHLFGGELRFEPRVETPAHRLRQDI